MVTHKYYYHPAYLVEDFNTTKKQKNPRRSEDFLQ